MDQKEQVLQFNRQLDRLLAGRPPDTTLSSHDQQALKLALRLSLANFSSESSIRDSLELRLLNRSPIEVKPIKVGLLQLNLSTWAMAALVLVILLIHSIGIPVPLPAIVASKLPAPVYMAVLSTNSATPSMMATAQTIKPVPVPTPLAISAIIPMQNRPSLASTAKTQPWLISSGETQTPKPVLQPDPGARP